MLTAADRQAPDHTLCAHHTQVYVEDASEPPPLYTMARRWVFSDASPLDAPPPSVSRLSKSAVTVTDSAVSTTAPVYQ